MQGFRYILFILCTGLITLFACKPRKIVSDSRGEIKFDSSQVQTVVSPNDSDSAGIKVISMGGVRTDSGQVADTPRPAPKKFLDDKVDYSCFDSIVFDVKSKYMYLYDSSKINYTTVQLEAYYVEIDMNRKQLHAEGIYDSLFEVHKQEPVFTDGEKSFASRTMDYNFETKKGLIKEAFTSEGETYLHAKIAKRDSNEIIYVKDAKFTTCSDPNPHFHIATTKAKIIPNDIVVTGPANLQIMNIPTPLVLPFGFFPTKEKRTSGILLPEYGEIDRYGFFLRNLGYYFAINRKFDLSLYANIYSSLSFGARAVFNYKIKYKFTGSVDIGFNNMQYGDPKIVQDYRRDQDFRFSWSHTQDIKANPNSTFQASVNVQTGNYSKFTTTDVNGIVQNIFNSNIQYSRRFANTPLSLSLGIQHDQNTQLRTVNLTLPNFNFFVTRWVPFKRKVQTGSPRWYESIALNYSFNFRTDLRTLDTILTRNFTGALQQVNPGIKQDIVLSASFKTLKVITVNPSVTYREIWNFRNLNIAYDPVAMANMRDTVFGFHHARDVSGTVSFNTTPLYGYYYMKKGNLIGFQHVVLPSVSASYRPDLGDQRYGFFGNNGEFISYSPNEIGVFGAPINGESGSVDFTLTNRLEMKLRSKKDTLTGTKKIPIFDQLVFNTGYDFALDSLNLKNFTIRGNTTLFNSMLTVQFALGFDPYAFDTINNVATRINQFEFSKTKRLMRFTFGSVALGFNFRGQTKRNPKTEEGLSEMDKLILTGQAYNYVDFNVPYSFSLRYNLQYNKPLDKVSLTHTINLAGDFNITSKWKVAFNLNYDFVNNKITTSSIDIYRDLHCWEMRMTVIPFGVVKQYSFTINVKSQLLQALKLNRRRGYVNF